MAPSVSCVGPVLHGAVTASRARSGVASHGAEVGQAKAHGGVANLVLHARSLGPGRRLAEVGRGAQHLRVAD